LDCFGIGKIIGDNLPHFGEMPTIPLFYSHRICVELLVEVI
jgi:hypothetical protein